MKLIGANKTLFMFEDQRIQRDFTNTINRIHNMDYANLEKKAKAARETIQAIKRTYNSVCVIQLLE